MRIHLAIALCSGAVTALLHFQLRHTFRCSFLAFGSTPLSWFLTSIRFAHPKGFPKPTEEVIQKVQSDKLFTSDISRFLRRTPSALSKRNRSPSSTHGEDQAMQVHGMTLCFPFNNNKKNRAPCSRVRKRALTDAGTSSMTNYPSLIITARKWKPRCSRR